MTNRTPQPETIAPGEITARREALGMTQVQLCAALGIARRQLQRYEAGEWPAPALFIFALNWLEHTTRRRRK